MEDQKAAGAQRKACLPRGEHRSEATAAAVDEAVVDGARRQRQQAQPRKRPGQSAFRTGQGPCGKAEGQRVRERERSRLKIAEGDVPCYHGRLHSGVCRANEHNGRFCQLWAGCGSESCYGYADSSGDYRISDCADNQRPWRAIVVRSRNSGAESQGSCCEIDAFGCETHEWGTEHMPICTVDGGEEGEAFEVDAPVARK